MSKIKSDKIVKKFNLSKFICNHEEYEVKNVELAIYYFSKDFVSKDNSVVIFGRNDVNHFKLQSKKEQERIIKKIKNEKISFFIFTDLVEKNNFLIDEISKMNVDVFTINYSAYEVFSNLHFYISRRNQVAKRVHGTMLSMFGEGVIVMGESGIGKSEVSLELIKNGHFFIGDDAIDLTKYASQLRGNAPSKTREFIEVRGIGVINVKKALGYEKILKSSKLSLVIELIEMNNDVKTTIDRLGYQLKYKEFLGIEVPFIQIPVSSGRNISQMIETAVIVFKQRKYDGYNAIEELNERIKG